MKPFFTPGQWHEMAGVSSNDDLSDEKEAEVHVLKAYNEAMTHRQKSGTFRAR